MAPRPAMRGPSGPMLAARGLLGRWPLGSAPPFLRSGARAGAAGVTVPGAMGDFSLVDM